ncbi:efflux RND transporter permease subunit, partial [Candidatus Fermentibacterales bacterium]|nr:efflux RND transporter permease subunit [Candidatus Fermentibacterales bacterium]
MIRTVLNRPRGTSVVFAALLLLAAVSFTRIPIEGTPETTLPSLNVVTIWQGAAPEAVTEQLTRPIEEVARQVEGVEEISSRSEASQSMVTVSFAKGTDMDVAAMELTERISLIREDLPDGVLPSTVSQSVPREMESEGFLIYALTGAEKTVLVALAEDVIKPRLERLEGVSSVFIEGLGEEQIVVDVDLETMRALDLTLSEVAEGIRSGLIDRNVGVAVDSSGLETVIRVSTLPSTIRDFSRMVVAVRGSRFVTLGDISNRIVQEFNENRQSIFRYNGLDQISLQVDRSPGSNAVRVAGSVRSEVRELQGELPEGVGLEITEDGTESIREDLGDLSWRALLSLGGIILVLLLLNPRFQSTPLILSSILFSAALAVTAVYLVGYSINVLTLSALAIAFGLLVDGAVVVMESIGYRRRQGLEPLKAAEIGAREVALPVLGGILTTMVAFVPLLASQGTLRLYYRPFAFTVASTLAASYLVCLTLVPSLVGHWKSRGWFRVRRWDVGLGRAIAVL